jgi:hypothetical protein
MIKPMIRASLITAVVAAAGTLALSGCGEAETTPEPDEKKAAPGDGAGGLDPDPTGSSTKPDGDS